MADIWNEVSSGEGIRTQPLVVQPGSLEPVLIINGTTIEGPPSAQGTGDIWNVGIPIPAYPDRS